MADTVGSFDALLSAAPMGEDEGALSVVGYLTRSPTPGKFGLVLADGRSVTLDVAAVREHAVLAGSVGQSLIRVTLDSTKVSSETAAELRAGVTPDIGTPAYIDGTLAEQTVNPFVLQHGHHASQATVVALQALGATANATRITGHIYDKPPIQDGTYPTPHGFHLDY